MISKLKLSQIRRDINIPNIWRHEAIANMDDYASNRKALDGASYTDSGLLVTVTTTETSHIRCTLTGYITRTCSIDAHVVGFSSYLSLNTVSPAGAKQYACLGTSRATATEYSVPVAITYVYEDMPAGTYALTAFGKEAHRPEEVGYMYNWNLTMDICRV